MFLRLPSELKLAIMFMTIFGRIFYMCQKGGHVGAPLDPETKPMDWHSTAIHLGKQLGFDSRSVAFGVLRALG
jgi:hypothetical protein